MAVSRTSVVLPLAAGACLSAAPQVALLAAGLGGVLFLLVAGLASLAVLSRHQHRRRAAYQVLALLTGNRPARSP